MLALVTIMPKMYYPKIIPIHIPYTPISNTKAKRYALPYPITNKQTKYAVFTESARPIPLRFPDMQTCNDSPHSIIMNNGNRE